MTGARAWGLSLGIAVLAVLLLGPRAAAAAPTPPLDHDGAWITDRDGRVVILHGVNMVYKVDPYTPRTAGFGADDARWLARHGFNTVRLGLIYAGVEPRPGRVSKRYLRSIARTERRLSARGIYSLLDFHQDLYNERFQGEGFPDWAVQDDGLPASPQVGFPGNYFVMLGLQRAYDNFWANSPGPDGAGLQDHYARAWRKVAKRFARAPRVLGYDLFNEPFPGSTWLLCANPLGCPAQDQAPLGEFTNRTIAQIRKVDRTTLAFYEPWVTFDFGAATSHPDTGDRHAGMSWHDYCLPAGLGAGTLPLVGDACGVEEELPFDNAEAQAEATGDTHLLTEFGATDDLPTIGRLVDLADEHMVGWQYWHYCACGEPTSQVSAEVQALVIDPHKRPRGKNVKRAKLRVLDRPYPQVVAGTPEHYSFDTDTGVFELAYSTELQRGGRAARRLLTEIYVPRIQYPRGYEVAAVGAKAVSGPRSRIVRLRRMRRADDITVTITPR